MKKLDKRIEQRIEDFLNKSERSINEAKEIFRGYLSSFPSIIEKAQECVELSLKALFLLVGENYPKDHAVGKFLTKNFLETKLKGFPPYLIWEKIPHIRLISNTLADWKNLATYGDEEIDAASNQIFGEDEANFAIKGAEKALDSVRSCYYHYRYEVSKMN